MAKGRSKAGGGGALSKAYSDIMSGNATLDSLNGLQPQMAIDKANFTSNGNSIKLQNVTIKNGNQTINLTFTSEYEPTQVGSPRGSIETKITARVWENGNIKGIRTIDRLSTKSIKNAKKQYEDMLDSWKKLTGQRSITF